MNKRIKEMAVQADGYWEHGDYDPPTYVCFLEEDLVKFVESIVLKCGEIAVHNVSNISTHADGEYVEGLMKEYFGV